ncbi:MAG: pyridoxal 5'-phosphate synthase glutaminase subunit PdxT [Candidatus Hodarchaeales archaeon]|jgi:5'-phosphate synthase pdxT subunit
MKKLRLGILALQGDVSEHVTHLNAAAKSRDYSLEINKIKKPSQLAGLNGLVIPGGESTTMACLINGETKNGTSPLKSRIQEMANDGLPIFGVCAGAILLANTILNRPSDGKQQVILNLLEATILRNAYGRQKESFETLLSIPMFGDQPIPAVFIRAPRIEQVGNKVEVLGHMDNNPVLIKQDNLLAVTFHPELAKDYRIANYFLDMCETSQ